MANAIAESLLALLAGAAPAYSSTKARRGQESRDLELGLKTRAQDKAAAAEKEGFARGERAVDRYNEQTYRERVLLGQEDERKSDRGFKERQLDLVEQGQSNAEELKRIQQDNQNRQAILQTQIEGYQGLLSILRAKGEGKSDKSDLTPEEMYSRDYSKAAIEVLTDPEIQSDRAGARLAAIKKTLREAYGLNPAEGGSTEDDIAAALAAAKGLSGGAGGISPLNSYPSSPVGGFLTSPADSEFEMRQRYPSRLKVLVP